MKLWQWIRGLFASDVRAYPNITPATNRKERRARASMARKQASRRKSNRG